MLYDIVIIGSGLAGATSARVLAENGFKVLVVEKERNIGGQCFDYKDSNNITVHKYGPHIFHTKEKRVWDFVTQFSEFNHFQHSVLSYSEGNFVEFPINRITINKIFGLQLSCNEVEDFLIGEVKRSTFNTPHISFRDVIVSQVGERLYSMFFENYTKKQWNTDPENLSPELAFRIPIRTNNDSRYFTDMYQGIPKDGYTKMISNMLDHSNIQILLGCDYFSKKGEIKSNLTIYTGELDRFFDYKFGELEYRSVRIELKTYDTKQFQPAPVVNYPNDYDWTRTTEFKQLTGEVSDKTTICYEYPLAKGHAFYTVPTKENNDKRLKYMHEVAQLESLGKFLFIGRLAEYRYYNMDNVIAATLDKVNNWLNNHK
ncbi:UDP-galactopyranose mutase [Dysgonomonas sp. GY617]|uniref:UDP-galactopyranose mutase n=1 Tax=Dysgonomonas sp. GY617 TaxID=2780420 RepID=UPI0018844FD6|nr:UDP-galactopyranose mutase [Dysgonomonas sp. GY617]MBF0574907.1 UDP-galactopyranose mutase [Dysgonomonas sp. GY617]